MTRVAMHGEVRLRARRVCAQHKTSTTHAAAGDQHEDNTDETAFPDARRHDC
jgi:hypothetical protein